MRGDDLVAAVRVRCRIPDGDAVASDAELLGWADEELSGVILPLVQSARAGYGLTYADQSLVAGQADYRIPQRAQMSGLADVLLLDTQGLATSIPQVPSSEAWRVGTQTGSPGAFTIEGDRVKLLPAPSVSLGSLRLQFCRRPSRLTLASAAAAITSVGSAPTYAVAAAGSVTNGVSVDVVQGVSGWDVLASDVTVSVAALNFTLPSAVSGAAVGDYIALAGTTPVVQLPSELHQLLVQAVTVRVYEALGDKQGVALALAQQERLLGYARSMLSPRVHGEVPRIVNHGSFLRGGGRRWR